ncbi:tRNA (adenosine(37)-N6)-threonylcarbamoyltransferase complex dimerization subunit type 1 TsaB [Kaistia sp. 32K]|uniref:tRNA (adenosine(37)-N6)-threonylcarbamoyltransferase complex dimerization subunit type 1 TsaB n=1 Tax=Kaistia sp. 32K TaxID=2795690 RepID=UPI001915A67E|nr:tRNA (adenosine(37)-N6)-threonylcarbamoyltransferase complex dimerization subunit type 1 TsaB [Kaistia sp. 32K]BCP55866.1 tRNA (adenosine(37)-N6)-threonylcarbamoyltransferase complex dimerization subunit type 1 TsaB [Kaistia sp. 32K]
MTLLAIDTALENCSVALEAGGTVFLRERTIGKGHAELLMPEIAAVLAEAGVSAGSLTRIIVSVGPGSFTGLRVGISAARGLALVNRIPVVGVTTLESHAALAARERPEGDDRPILALLPARGDELYGQLFSASLQPLGEATLGSIEAFAALAVDRDADLAGAGALRLERPDRVVHARSAPDIATLLARGAALDPATHPPKPLYIRPPDAQPQHHKGIQRQ